MGKVVSATEFKARCLQLIAEMEKDGQPVTITRRGKAVAKVVPEAEAKKPGLLGLMKGAYRWAPGVDPTDPVEPDWEANWEAKWDARDFPASKDAHER